LLRSRPRADCELLGEVGRADVNFLILSPRRLASESFSLSFSLSTFVVVVDDDDDEAEDASRVEWLRGWPVWPFWLRGDCCGDEEAAGDALPLDEGSD